MCQVLQEAGPEDEVGNGGGGGVPSRFWSLQVPSQLLHSQLCACMLRGFSLTPWIAAHQAPLSMGFSRQEYWSGWVTMPSSRGSSPPRDRTCVSCVSCFASRFFTTEPPGKPAHTQLHFFKSHTGLFSSEKIEKLRTSHSGKWE